MAALSPLSQERSDARNGRHVFVTEVLIASSSDTLALPEGLNNVAHVAVVPVDSSDTAASAASLSQGEYPAANTVTLTGGTVGSRQLVISVHFGNPAGL